MRLQEFRWILDVTDVLVVAFLFYHVFMLVRGTRAAQMFLGLVAILLLTVLAELAQLSALNWLLTSLKTVWVVAFLIIFQPELRKGLSQIGYSRIFHRLIRLEETSHLSEIEHALISLRRRGLGAILVLERNTGLRAIAETGTLLDATLSAELLETIFTPPSPLHDGAVLIRGNQVVAAGCILPLSQNPNLDRSLGTRHRAAIGLSEEQTPSASWSPRKPGASRWPSGAASSATWIRPRSRAFCRGPRWSRKRKSGWRPSRSGRLRLCEAYGRRT